MSREIKITWDEPDTFDKPIQNAIGYLSLWAINSERYAKVNLSVDADKNVSANYFGKTDNLTYSIFGLRDGEGYSFHS